MKKKITKKLKRRKHRIQYRRRDINWKEQNKPMFVVYGQMKHIGKRSVGNPHAAFDEAGTGNVAQSRYCDTRKRKGE